MEYFGLFTIVSALVSIVLLILFIELCANVRAVRRHFDVADRADQERRG